MIADGRPRLLYLGGFDFPTPQARGIQSLHTAHALARAGWSVRLLVQRPAGRRVDPRGALEGYGLSPHPRCEIVRLPVLRPSPRLGLEIHKRLAISNWSYGLASIVHLLRHWSQIDLVFVRDPRLAWLYIVTRPIHRRPVVYEVHEIFSTRPRDNRSLEPGEVHGVADRTRALERTVFSQADLLIPLTSGCADLLVGLFGADPARMAVVPDGTMAPPSALPPRAPGPPEIVYAGQLYPWKGVDVLLAAVARLPGQHLTIMGGRSPDARDDPDLASCRAIAARLGLGSRVAFGGFVPYGEVRSRLAGAGAAVLPLPDRLMSRYFTSPLKLFDYMAAGVPIVASDLPAVREVLTDGEDALLVPPGDPGVLAGALERLLTDHELGERLRQRAFAEVSRYTWDRRAERIIRAVMDVVATELPIVDGPAGARSARAFARVR